MNIKKIFIFLSVIMFFFFSIASNVFALESEVKLKGGMDFQAVHYKTNGKPSQQKYSVYQNKYGFYSAGNIYLNYNLISDNELKYGAKIGIEHTFKNNRGIPAAIFLESKYGKIEGGSDKSAGKKMKITGYTASCESSGSWDSFVKASPDSSKISYVTNFCSFLDSKMRVSGKVEYSRKVTYFTPKINIGDNNKLQIGLSYIPDASNMGNALIDTETTHSPVGASAFKFSIKDALSYGAVHEVDLSENTSVKTAFVGEVGHPTGFKEIKDDEGKITTEKSDIKFSNLNSYVIGTEVKYDNTSVAFSYGNYNNSLTSSKVDKISRSTYLAAGGVKYNWNKYAVSFNHFHSVHKKNKFNASTVGLEYNVTRGIKSYCQMTYFQAKGKYFNENKDLVFDKSKGSLVVFGTKLSF